MVFVSAANAKNSKGKLMPGVSEIKDKNGKTRYISTVKKTDKKEPVKKVVKKVVKKEPVKKIKIEDDDADEKPKITKIVRKKKVKSDDAPLKVEF